MSKGYVYILTNPCIRYTYHESGKVVTISPVKIGMAKDVEKRLGSLNTSLPENFVHHMSLVCDDMKAVENVVHLYLDKYRIKTKDGEKTEFFRCSVEEAKSALKQTAKIMHVREYHIDKTKIVGRSVSRIKSNSKAAREAKIPKESISAGSNSTARRGVFRFSDYGIKPGEKVYFRKDTSKFAVVVDDRHVRYGGGITSLSALAKVLLGRSSAVQGPLHFTYDGRRLSDMERRSLPVVVNQTAKPVQSEWKNSTQLAKAIVEKYNGGKSKGNLWHILNRKRPVAPDSKWRSILEGIGLAFDKDNLVVDWKMAKKEGAAA